MIPSYKLYATTCPSNQTVQNILEVPSSLVPVADETVAMLSSDVSKPLPLPSRCWQNEYTLRTPVVTVRQKHQWAAPTAPVVLGAGCIPTARRQ
jgi:hypothetical protein